MEPYGKVRYIQSDTIVRRKSIPLVSSGSTDLRTYEPNKTFARSTKSESGGRGWLQSLVPSASSFVHGEVNKLDTCKCDRFSGTVLRAIPWLCDLMIIIKNQSIIMV